LKAENKKQNIFMI